MSSYLLPFRRSALRASAVAATSGLLLLLNGCASSAGFDLASARPGEAPRSATSYRLVYGDLGRSQDDPRVSETLRRVKVALAEKGLVEALPDAPPTMEIDLTFGQGVSEPALVPSTDYLSSLPDWPANRVIGVDPAAKPSLSYRDPAGHLVTLRPATVQLKFLRLTAREAPESAGANPPRELWQVAVSKNDEATFQSCLPAMVAAARNKIPAPSVTDRSPALARIATQ